MTSPSADGERLHRIVLDAATGRFPASDGSVTVLHAEPDELAGILAFTGHHVIVGDVDPAWVHAHLDHGDMSAPVAPAFVAAFAAHLGRSFDNLDLVFAARPEAAAATLELIESAPDGSHPRIERSMRYRRDLRVHRTPDDGGVLVIGRGLGDRWELAFEVEPSHRGRGLGRALVASALRLVPAGEPVFAQVAPGNAASLRTLLSVGAFAPIGAEILFPPVGTTTTSES